MWGMQMHKCLRGIMPVTQTAVSAADAWGRDSVPCGVPWHRSVCRGVVCGDLGAGLSGPAVAGGLVWSCWTILVALYARVRPIARVEVPERVSMRTSPRLQNIRRWVRAELGFTFEPCHVSGCFEHAKTHRNRMVVVVFSQSIVRKSRSDLPSPLSLAFLTFEVSKWP